MAREVTAADPLPYPWPKDRRPQHLDAWLQPGVAPPWNDCDLAEVLDGPFYHAGPLPDTVVQEAAVRSEVERRRLAEQTAADRQPATQGDIREIKALLVELARRAKVAS